MKPCKGSENSTLIQARLAANSGQATDRAASYLHSRPRLISFCAHCRDEKEAKAGRAVRNQIIFLITPVSQPVLGRREGRVGLEVRVKVMFSEKEGVWLCTARVRQPIGLLFLVAGDTQ